MICLKSSAASRSSERDVQDKVAAAERQSEHQEAELGRVTEALNGKVAERQKLEALVADRLHGSDDFKKLSEQALAAETELERNEGRVAEIKAEADKKLPSYERSRLFKYLYNAGYGTAEYAGKGLTRSIDAWVAKMIDYASARRGYDFLRVTPELMQHEVGRRRASFNGLMQQVEAIEDHVSDEVGLTAVLKAGQLLGAERDASVAAAAKAQDELLKQQHELLALAGSKNEFYEQGLARMQNFLANLPPTRLADESRATPERDDDAIVAEVTYLSGQLTEADQRMPPSPANGRRGTTAWAACSRCCSGFAAPNSTPGGRSSRRRSTPTISRSSTTKAGSRRTIFGPRSSGSSTSRRSGTSSRRGSSPGFRLRGRPCGAEGRLAEARSAEASTWATFRWSSCTC